MRTIYKCIDFVVKIPIQRRLRVNLNNNCKSRIVFYFNNLMDTFSSLQIDFKLYKLNLITINIIRTFLKSNALKAFSKVFVISIKYIQ